MLGELAIRAGEVVVIDLELGLVSLKFAFHFANELLVSTLPVLELGLSAVVDSLALLKDLLVEIEFLFVKTVNSLHVFHTLLKNLHFLLKLDLLVGLVVGVLRSNLLKFLSLILLVVVTLLLVVLFSLLMGVEQKLDLVGIALEERLALVPELLLDSIKLGTVRVAHKNELNFHLLD